MVKTREELKAAILALGYLDSDGIASESIAAFCPWCNEEVEYGPERTVTIPHQPHCLWRELKSEPS